VAAALLMAGIWPEYALRAFVVGAILSFVAGTAGVIPSDAAKASERRRWLGVVAIPVVVGMLLLLEAAPANHGDGAPQRLLTLPSAIVLGIACGGFQLLQALAIAAYWPRAQARSSLSAGLLVFVAGFIDMAGLLGAPVPLVGAVTAGAIASAYIGSRMLAQFRVALEGAEGRVPGYALQRFLGAGGMAEVFVAEAVGLLGDKRVAAVKRVRRDLVDNHELCAMFLDEARLAAELEHPNIVRVYGFGTGAPGSAVRPYIAMELVEGLPLAVILRVSSALRRPLPMAAVARIGVALCSALEYAHRRCGQDGEPLGIVHRDVSPHNVLVSQSGEVKLIDFGIARAKTREVQTKTGQMRGKLAYASPEQIAAGPVDARTDVFSLGVLLYEVTTLTRPFMADSEPAVVSAILEGRRRKILDLRPDAGAALADVIERAMEPDPDARWASAAELGAAIERAIGAPLASEAMLGELVRFAEAEKGRLREFPSLLPPPPASSSAPSSGSDTTPTVVDPGAAIVRE
jgi:serine/threonine protein kinase